MAEITGEALALIEAVDEAIEKSALFSIKRTDSRSAALLGVRRSELAAAILQFVVASGRFDAAGIGIHSALFGKLHQYNFHYQGILYGLDEGGVNAQLNRAAQGTPPRGSVSLPPVDRADPAFSPQTLEAAHALAVAPLKQETNAVGGLADIMGMQRSDTVGGENHLWRMLVSTLLETSGVLVQRFCPVFPVQRAYPAPNAPNVSPTLTPPTAHPAWCACYIGPETCGQKEERLALVLVGA